MKSQMHARNKTTREQTPDTTAKAKPMYQSRPFVVQSESALKSQPPDLKASLKEAERYGHHLSKKQFPTDEKGKSAENEVDAAKKLGKERNFASDAGNLGRMTPIQKAENGEERDPAVLRQKYAGRWQETGQPWDKAQSHIIDKHGDARHIDANRQVAEYMRGTHRAAERMELPPQGQKNSKGYTDTPIRNNREILAAGARQVKNQSGNVEKMQLLDQENKKVGKVYSSPYSNNTRSENAARSPKGQTPFSSIIAHGGPNKSDYSKKADNNIYGNAHYNSTDSSARNKRAAVSVSEMTRGMGAGAGQIMAEESGYLFDSNTTRDGAYGNKDTAGRMPAAYKGSQKDIITTETAALQNDDEKMMETRLGKQLNYQLDYERRQRHKPLERSASEPLPATRAQQREETNAALKRTGFNEQDVRRAGLEPGKNDFETAVTGNLRKEELSLPQEIQEITDFKKFFKQKKEREKK
ncbi:MAG: hypothetical protein KME46_21660 [Brasilonema angustatum HA4187-MV1]|jgi:hypothetical protein|nr:hypothetical protein [Brasilonema angustatum HA4187-MV1]